MRSFAGIEEVQQSILQMLKACPVLLFIENGFTDALTRIMHAYPRNLQVQMLACEILARKNMNAVTGLYCEMEPMVLCRALEIFANNIRVARPAMESMVVLARRFSVACLVDPDFQNVWGAARPLRLAFGKADGRLDFILLQVLLCITSYDIEDMSASAHEMVSSGCRILKHLLQANVLALQNRQATPCITGIDKILLAVLVNGKRQNSAVMMAAQRFSWKLARDTAQSVLVSLIRADALSPDNNIARILAQMCVDGDMLKTELMTEYCTNMDRQNEFRECGPAFLAWMQSMPEMDLGTPLDGQRHSKCVYFVRFLGAFSKNNPEHHSLLITLDIPQRFCQMLTVLAQPGGLSEVDRMWLDVKYEIILVLQNFFFQPMRPAALQSMVMLIGAPLQQTLIKMITMRSKCNDTVAPGCILMLSYILSTHTSEHTTLDARLMTSVVYWLDRNPNALALQANGFTLMCLLQVHGQATTTISMAITHAFSCVYKNRSNAEIMNPCIRFLYHLSAHSDTTRNLLREMMQGEMCLIMHPQITDVAIAVGDAGAGAAQQDPLGAVDVASTIIHPRGFLQELLHIHMPEHSSYLTHLIEAVLSNTC